MLFQVEMNVRLPQDLPAEKAEALKQTQRARATRRRVAPSVASGPLRQHQIADPQEQNGILSSLPLFPFMDMRITPLCRQPSSVHDDYRYISDQLSFIKGERQCLLI